MRRQHFAHELVDFIPECLEDGVLYISNRYKTAVHKCACGCGEEVVTPLSPADWSIRFDDGGATLDPSIGNWSFACRSHYFIWAGKVAWAREMSHAAIEHNRAFDAKLRESYIRDINRLKRRGRVQRAWEMLLKYWAHLSARRRPPR